MNDKIFLIIQCANHLICIFVSLYVIIPLGAHLNDFRGHCALFSCGHYIEDDGHFEPDWANKSPCIISILIGSFTFICSFVQIFMKLRLLYKNEECTFFHAFLCFFFDCVVALFVLIDSIITTIGFYIWCHCVTQRFSSCNIASSVMEIGVNSTIVAKNFSYQLGIVQFGTWALLVCVCLQLMLSMRKVFLYHERLNLIAGMSSERRRHNHRSEGYSSLNER
uniref:Transmembrane protein 179-like n=1 Tax=Dermatophagoides pteronyssinus TaxID=6956 RepID=A0A6P6XVE6_DERPT|nr:transmembrane protein 179-like [Dermatophagoides pteronyssinus]